MITECDAEAGRDQQKCQHRELEPINAKIPQVKRHCRECGKEGADQERTRRPIDAVCRDPEVQTGILEGGSPVEGYRPAENDVLLCPGVDAAAVRTGEPLCLHYGCPPALFFYCPSRVGQL